MIYASEHRSWLDSVMTNKWEEKVIDKANLTNMGYPSSMFLQLYAIVFSFLSLNQPN